MGLFGEGIEKGKTMFFRVKEGEEAVGIVREMGIKEGDQDPKFHYKRKDGSYWTRNGKFPNGFHHEGLMEVESGDTLVWTIGAISLFITLDNSPANTHDKIRVKHPGKGKYEIEVLQKDCPVSKDGAPF